MITSLTVKSFRSLRSVTLDRLGRFTLIGGKNGAGKTALLEAVWLLSGADLPELGPRVDTLRGLPPFGPENVFRDIFHDFKTNQRITVSANGDWEIGPAGWMSIFRNAARSIRFAPPQPRGLR